MRHGRLAPSLRQTAADASACYVVSHADAVSGFFCTSWVEGTAVFCIFECFGLCLVSTGVNLCRCLLCAPLFASKGQTNLPYGDVS